MDKDIKNLLEVYKQYKENPFNLTAIMLYDDCLWNLEDYLSEYNIDLSYDILVKDDMFQELLMTSCYFCHYDWSIGIGYEETIEILSETISYYMEKQ